MPRLDNELWLQSVKLGAIDRITRERAGYILLEIENLKERNARLERLDREVEALKDRMINYVNVMENKIIEVADILESKDDDKVQKALQIISDYWRV